MPITSVELLFPPAYVLLIAMWSLVLYFYCQRIRTARHRGRLMLPLLSIIAIDALRALFVSFYFGASHSARVGLLPASLRDALAQPEMLVVPTLLELLAVTLIVTILFRDWLPRERGELRQAMMAVDTRAEELSEPARELRPETTRHELEIAKNRAQQYLDIAGVILVAIDPDRRVSLINQKGCEILGSSAGEIIGKDWVETFVPVNVRPNVIRTFDRLMAGEIEPVEYFENPVLTRGGRERLIAWHNAVLRTDEGRIAGTLSSGEDITEHRRAENRIRGLNRSLHDRAIALEAANKELESFAYSVSHDLRAPLRHVDGFLGLLEKRAGPVLDEKSRHYIATISRSAEKMDLLIDNLLSFSRMGRQAMSCQAVDLGRTVRDVIRELEPDLAGRQIEWHIGDLPVVEGDAAMLRIVLGNLVSNALKFTEPRQRTEIEIVSTPDYDTEVVICVRDNGVGFDMTHAEKLFGVFQRLHRAEEFAGTGIGLANVRRVIARHGGRTWAQGEPGQGAAFYFSLPRTR